MRHSMKVLLAKLNESRYELYFDIIFYIELHKGHIFISIIMYVPFTFCFLPVFYNFVELIFNLAFLVLRNYILIQYGEI